MVSLDVTETSKSLAVAGGYVSIFGIFSYFVKEKLFMSEALIALLVGIITGPIALSWFDPFSWSDDQYYLTHQITRVVIAIQVLFTGIALPKRYLKREWLSLVTLLGPIMTTAWFVSSLLIWGLIPGLTFLESLVIGACVTPTDPVLSNAICKGRYAEKNVPLHVRNIIVAEAGANDGLGFPFLFLGLYLILIHEPTHPRHSIGGAIGEWFYNILFYQIILSCLIGAAVGLIARKLLKFAKQRQLIDHESFLSFGVALTFFTLGWVGMIGSDDILCCFVVGNSFTWDDWFRLETEDAGFQDVIDQLLNSAIFLYVGAIIPWSDFSKYSLSPWRLVVLGILIMLLRRLPWVWALSRWIPALKTHRESVFAGFFGPIGVGAVFYVQVALDVIPEDGTRGHLREVLLPVVYFLVLTSVVVHGVTIPIGKGGFRLARTMTMSGSRNATGANEGMVSRLPPPVELPSRSQTQSISVSGHDGTPMPLPLQDHKLGSQPPPEFSADRDRIRFGDLDPDSTTAATTIDQKTPIGILSRRNSSENVRDTDTQEAKASDDRLPETDDTSSRPGLEGSRPSRIWVEGHDIVEESEDGETVRVIHGDKGDRHVHTHHRNKD
ncbi:hypothetical protein L486_06867 [Kwoniella mangroviensis CBS 10435]|uniref:Cation/H+ exchanger transmembrane domain-containing protein n=1 Tax=Kwoniella mangroviensis CBS 10435 TaxID=1331196 RepID=A0A1B9IJ24_9TREE|nr:uncharacterized protein I203_06886 [Kwoniella mangroviensis CBS 8507]OCF55384.1 hypothetical protein L486_06867 [Kwoniella mangroviensis CBS 10435]OCF63930.1 hypothetical protein I203_06886 [Kwoniella mangroviensis CBS 8507]OCF73889.1 hypothetical protein I204_05734 [Kwoniella mangroviensis CBS 8886]